MVWGVSCSVVLSCLVDSRLRGNDGLGRGVVLPCGFWTKSRMTVGFVKVCYMLGCE